MSVIAIAVIAFGAGRTRGQVPFFGVCPDLPTMPHFQPDKYMGKWYEAERYFALFEFGGKCVTGDYGFTDNGEIAIINRQISAITGMESTIEGRGNVISRNEAGKLVIGFPSFEGIVNYSAPYWILHTDYDNYSIIWSCNNFGIISTKNAWILTRTRTPTSDVTERVTNILDAFAIDRSYFIRTDQKNCPANH